MKPGGRACPSIGPSEICVKAFAASIPPHSSSKRYPLDCRAGNGGRKQQPGSTLAESFFPGLARRARQIPSVRALRCSAQPCVVWTRIPKLLPVSQLPRFAPQSACGSQPSKHPNHLPYHRSHSSISSVARHRPGRTNFEKSWQRLPTIDEKADSRLLGVLHPSDEKRIHRGQLSTTRPCNEIPHGRQNLHE